MPLIRHAAQKPEENYTGGLPAMANVAATETVVLAAPKVEAPKAAYTGRKSAEKPMSKEDYWANREARDIEKDKHIRLSGVLQALLGSVNFGQYCTGTTAEDYLTKVEEAALRLAKFVTEKA